MTPSTHILVSFKPHFHYAVATPGWIINGKTMDKLWYNGSASVITQPMRHCFPGHYPQVMLEQRE